MVGEMDLMNMGALMCWKSTELSNRKNVEAKTERIRKLCWDDWGESVCYNLIL